MTKTINEIVGQANKVWVRHWAALFSDPEGGFYERLTLEGQPIERSRRVLSQCRQLIVYSRAYNVGAFDDKEFLTVSFDYILNHYAATQKGGFVFSVDDGHLDLYAHAFIILMCAAYFKATADKRALIIAEETAQFIEQNFKHKNGLGFYEALTADYTPIIRIRRQNPHMHLLEACLAMVEVTQENRWKKLSQEMLSLFEERFFDSTYGVLREFFNDDLTPHSQEGDKIEAGHHAEWVWLLTRYHALIGDKSAFVAQAKKTLFDFVVAHGIDKKNGGLFNVQNPDGSRIDPQKRIWPVMETLRAASLMKSDNKEAQAVFDKTLECFLDRYMDTETGLWHEILDEDMNKISDYLPATTPYHIYLALLDCLDYLE